MAGNQGFIDGFLSAELEPQTSALRFNDANEVLLRVDYLIVGFEYDVADFYGFVVKNAFGGDAVDSKSAANTEGGGAVAHIDQTGNDQR